MSKEEIIEDLEVYKTRLTGEVLEAYENRGSVFGSNRFSSWRKKLSQFLNDKMNGEETRFNQALFMRSSYIRGSQESDGDYFWKNQGDKAFSYVDSLILDIGNDEYMLCLVSPLT
jgi:hypothetical protein